ncbi:MAG TPA: flavodoxin family protein [Desulfobaccales bacterium]
MRLIAFNSSPRDNQTSKTELVLQKFLEGARRAGAETETLYLRDYKIKHCLGCFSCWTKTPGRCVQKDDMAEELFGRYLAADLAVLATPLYHFNMNARMKMFIERTCPWSLPSSRIGATSPATATGLSGSPRWRC